MNYLEEEEKCQDWKLHVAGTFSKQQVQGAGAEKVQAARLPALRREPGSTQLLQAHTGLCPLTTAQSTAGLHTSPQPPLAAANPAAHAASAGTGTATMPLAPQGAWPGVVTPLHAAGPAGLVSRTRPSRCGSRSWRTQPSQTSRDTATANATFLQLDLPAVRSPQPGKGAERVEEMR